VVGVSLLAWFFSAIRKGNLFFGTPRYEGS